jgi:12-oxophytodienoic acid reductase
MHLTVAKRAIGSAQCEDEHPYALHTYLLEELNKLGIAYVHFIEPRALHSMGVASPNAEFNFERHDQSLDVRSALICAR